MSEQSEPSWATYRDWLSGEGRRIANEHVDAGMRALNEKQARRWAEEESDV